MRASGDLTTARTERGDGPRPEWPNDLEPGNWISGRYVIVRCIGSGGGGAVYEAEQHSLGRQVAIKLLHPEQLRSAKGKERFEREARTAASINNRHVVAVYDFDTHQGMPYLVMELLRGQSVDQLLATGGRLPLRRGLALLLGASRGLEALHASGLVHRDLKPANLFVTQGDGEEYCKILDFGITKQREGQSVTASSELVGTPAYMAPERIDRPAEADQRVDIYALAVTAYEMFTGYNLHDGTPQEVLLRVMAGTLPPLAAFTAVMPEALAELLYRCLSKRPEDRPETAAELSAELERILRGLSASSDETFGAKVSPPTLRSTNGVKRRRAVPLAVVSGVLLVSLVAFLLVLRGAGQRAWFAAKGNEAPSEAPRAREQFPTAPSGAESAGAPAAGARAAGAESATPPPPGVRPLNPPPRARQRAESPQRSTERERVPRALAAGAARGGRPSANADPSLPVAPRVAPPGFVPRSVAPGFVARTADEPGVPRPTSARDRQPLAPGHLFRPRPDKED